MSKFRKLLSGLLFLSTSALLLLVVIFRFYTSEPNKKVLGLQNTTQSQKSYDTFSFNKEQIQYDTTILDVIEKDNYYLLLPESYSMFQYARLGSYDNRNEYIDSLRNSPLYLNDFREQEYLQGEGYDVNVFSFIQPDIFDKEKSLLLYLTVYTTPNNHYIEVRNFDYRDNSSIHNEFINILSQVEGNDREVLGSTNPQTDLARILGQASTLQIFSRNCYDVEFSDEMLMYTTSGQKKHRLCSSTIGSGFMINDTGEILTNAHVVKPHKLDTVVEGVSEDGVFEKDITDYVIFALDALFSLFGDYPTEIWDQLTEEELLTFYIYFVPSLYDEGEITISNGLTELYVQFGKNFDIDSDTYDLINKSEQQTASVIRSNDISSLYQLIVEYADSEGGMTDINIDELSENVLEDGLSGVSDIALIKLDQPKNIPSLPISQTNPMQGQNIYVIGYPSIDDESLVTSSDNLKTPTVTTGSIINIQKNTTNTYDLLQIDASVENGNSGGPILGNEGQVLGMTTYAEASDSGNYNWGISSTELNRFLSMVNSTSEVNEESLLLIDAMEDISKDYYSRGQKKLEELVAGESSLGNVLNPIISFCITNVENGNDKTPWINLEFLDFLELPNWVLMTMCGIIVVIIITLIIIAIVKQSEENNIVQPMYNYAGPAINDNPNNSSNEDNEYIAFQPTNNPPVDDRKDEYLVPQNNQLPPQPIQPTTQPVNSGQQNIQQQPVSQNQPTSTNTPIHPQSNQIPQQPVQPNTQPVNSGQQNIQQPVSQNRPSSTNTPIQPQDNQTNNTPQGDYNNVPQN
jgi:S1-C subfamily serine protease/uncharacterized protein YuzB (UPF0349 family)